MTRDAQLGSSLVDQQFNRQLEYRKALSGLDEAQARTSLYGAQRDNLQAESDNRKALLPLDVKAKQLENQKNQIAIDNLATTQDDH